MFDEAKAAPEALNEDTPIVAETPALDAALSDVATPQQESKKKGRKPTPGCSLSKIGEEISEQLDVIPAQIYVKRHRRFKYACKSCQENVMIAPVQNQAIPKTMAAPANTRDSRLSMTIKKAEKEPLQKSFFRGFKESFKRMGTADTTALRNRQVLHRKDALPMHGANSKMCGT